MRHITPNELKALLARANPAPLLLDVREPWEYRIAHIEGSILIPMRDIPSSCEALEREREVVVICHHGIRSQRVACFLEHVGFDRVYNLAGGIDAWTREVDPEMPVY